MPLLRTPDWPTPSKADLVRLSQLLVIDDKEFEYVPLFEADGYHLTVWDEVKDLQRLESGEFHVILLDMRGIGSNKLDFQGAGLIEHIKSANPAQYIIAYSSSRFTLDYQRFFEQADDKIRKSEDYATFKRSVDAGLAYRFSPAYYESRVEAVIGSRLDRKTRKEIQRAIYRRDNERIKKHLLRAGLEADTVDRVLNVCSIAASSLSLLLS